MEHCILCKGICAVGLLLSIVIVALGRAALLKAFPAHDRTVTLWRI